MVKHDSLYFRSSKMTQPVDKTKDVDCGECGAVVTLIRDSKTKSYEGECPGCGKQLTTE